MLYLSPKLCSNVETYGCWESSNKYPHWNCEQTIGKNLKEAMHKQTRMQFVYAPNLRERSAIKYLNLKALEAAAEAEDEEVVVVVVIVVVAASRYTDRPCED
jgi:hypothetical protein